ncbi:MAG: TnpV protein [Clostridia bacterium]|nr:TnpV protein [Clostridia bacterium]
MRKEVLRMNLTYTMKGNYLIPDLTIEKTNKKVNLGKFAKMRLKHLKENKRGTYTMLVASNKLTDHLIAIEKTVINRIAQEVEKMKQQYGITEEMKATNQMEWVGQMNNIQATAEQIAVREVIYN